MCKCYIQIVDIHIRIYQKEKKKKERKYVIVIHTLYTSPVCATTAVAVAFVPCWRLRRKLCKNVIMNIFKAIAKLIITIVRTLPTITGDNVKDTSSSTVCCWCCFVWFLIRKQIYGCADSWRGRERSWKKLNWIVWFQMKYKRVYVWYVMVVAFCLYYCCYCCCCCCHCTKPL